MYRPRKREVAFFFAWSAVVAVAVIVAVAGRMITGFRDRAAKIGLYESRLVKLTRILKHAAMIDAEYKRRIASAEPFKDSGSLIQGIENLARKSGVNLLSLKPVQVRDQEGGGVSALKVEVQDAVPSVVRFLSLINGEISGIGVERVQLFSRNEEELPHAVFMITAATGEENG